MKVTKGLNFFNTIW